MLAMAYMKPESRNEGRKVSTMASWLARSWLWVTMLMSMPSESAPARKIAAMAKSSGDASAQRHVEEELAHQHGQQHVQHAEREVGQELAEDQLRSLDRRGDELLHRALLPLARDGERGEQRRDHHHDHGDQAGDDVVLRFQVGVEPDARPQIEGRLKSLGGASARSRGWRCPWRRTKATTSA